MQTHNARLGVRLFLAYLACYFAFVLINALAPSVMEATPIAGLNWALLGGIGLILLAMLLALVYGVAAKSDAAAAEDGPLSETEGGAAV